MKTEIVEIKDINKAVELILQDEIVAFPTETVYGLGANAFSEIAVKKIFEAKGRPQDNPLIVHIANKNDVYMVAREVSEIAVKIIDKLMPNPLTIILPVGDRIPLIVTAGLDTVAIRMPSSKIAQEFIAKCGVPIVAPSANISTYISPTLAKHVYDDLNGRIPMIIDGGACEYGIESTVLDLTTPCPTILRPGCITSEMIEEVIGIEIVSAKKFVDKNDAPKAPGMKYKHYSPKIPLIIIADNNELIREYESIKSRGLKPILLTNGVFDYPSGIKSFIVGENELSIARNIYSALRALEKEYDYILSEDFSYGEIGCSVMNRLRKASS